MLDEGFTSETFLRFGPVRGIPGPGDQGSRTAKSVRHNRKTILRPNIARAILIRSSSVSVGMHVMHVVEAMK